jgi:hypothetical protein
LFVGALSLFIIAIFPFLTATLVEYVNYKSPYKQLKAVLDALGVDFKEVRGHVDKWLPHHHSTSSFNDLMAVVASYPDAEKRDLLNSKYTVQTMLNAEKLMDAKRRCFLNEHFEVLTGRVHTVDYEPGALLVEEGERTYSMFFLVSGTVIGTDRLGNHTPHQDLSFFHYEGILGDASDVKLKCLTHCKVCEIHQHVLLDLGDPDDLDRCFFWRIMTLLQRTEGEDAGPATMDIPESVTTSRRQRSLPGSTAGEENDPFNDTIQGREGMSIFEAIKKSAFASTAVPIEYKQMKDASRYKFYEGPRMYRALTLRLGLPDDIAREYLTQTAAVRNPRLQVHWAKANKAPLPLRWTISDKFGPLGCIFVANLASLPSYVEARVKEDVLVMAFLQKVEVLQGKATRDFMDRTAAFARLLRSQRWWLPALQKVPRSVPQVSDNKAVRWLWYPPRLSPQDVGPSFVAQQMHTTQSHSQGFFDASSTSPALNSKAIVNDAARLHVPRPNCPVSTLTYEQYVMHYLGLQATANPATVFDHTTYNHEFGQRRFVVGFNATDWLAWRKGEPPEAMVTRRESVPDMVHEQHFFLPHLGQEYDSAVRRLTLGSINVGGFGSTLGRSEAQAVRLLCVRSTLTLLFPLIVCALWEACFGGLTRDHAEPYIVTSCTPSHPRREKTPTQVRALSRFKFMLAVSI